MSFVSYISLFVCHIKAIYMSYLTAFCMSYQASMILPAWSLICMSYEVSFVCHIKPYLFHIFPNLYFISRPFVFLDLSSFVCHIKPQ